MLNGQADCQFRMNEQEMNEVASFCAPLIIRGEIIENADIEFGGRNLGIRFTAPDVSRHLDKLPLAAPAALSDLHALEFEEIVQFLSRLGQRLDFDSNPYLQQAFRASQLTSGLAPSILENCYRTLHRAFDAETVRQQGDCCLGRDNLDGWAKFRNVGNYTLHVRAFGARSLHIIAGNVPGVSALTIVRNAVTRSDMIIKTPSNDPLTAAAIARTMIDMAPDHPITRHVSVGYWKGGDTAIEEALYRPSIIEKIIAWGGLASIKHIARYIQPGIDLITLDPKLSGTIIGSDAFTDETTMRDVAARLAFDVGAYNQQACVSARVAYIQTGTDADGLKKAHQFGELLFDAIQALPATISAPAPRLSPELADEIDGLRYVEDLYSVFGGDGRGAVIVSHESEPVDFADMLNERVVNLVPVDDISRATRATNAYTQTIGIYPDALVPEIRDALAFQGVQRLVTLGHAPTPPVIGPADGIEPLRRMVKWVMHEVYDHRQGAEASAKV